MSSLSKISSSISEKLSAQYATLYPVDELFFLRPRSFFVCFHQVRLLNIIPFWLTAFIPMLHDTRWYPRTCKSLQGFGKKTSIARRKSRWSRIHLLWQPRQGCWLWHKDEPVVSNNTPFDAIQFALLAGQPAGGTCWPKLLNGDTIVLPGDDANFLVLTRWRSVCVGVVTPTRQQVVGRWRWIKSCRLPFLFKLGASISSSFWACLALDGSQAADATACAVNFPAWAECPNDCSTPPGLPKEWTYPIICNANKYTSRSNAGSNLSWYGVSSQASWI